MDRIKILDCTLRDGGYVNDFKFGKKVISDIVNSLSKAQIDIIECGFMKAGASDLDKSVFCNMEHFAKVVKQKKPELLYVVMIQVGAMNAEEVEDYNSRYADGIRLTFHEHEIEKVFTDAQILMKKGYKVFIQPVGTATYQDDALLSLVKRVNELNPFAFYIVDTMGTMYKNDLLRLFYLIDYNLNDSIFLGFHSHNNLQMSFANAQELSQISCNRNIIVDASIMGMGRGAGNLNTELFIQYLNVNYNSSYSTYEVMNIIDNYIKPLSTIYRWGYDVAYFLAATKICHPNYVSFLLNLQTLTVRDIEIILDMLDEKDRVIYNEQLIQQVYLSYMNHYINDDAVTEKIENMIDGREVILLAPGKSLQSFVGDLKGKFVISVNFIPSNVNIDMIFISNIKRFSAMEKSVFDAKIPIVLTSNISAEEIEKKALMINYYSYLNDDKYIRDNAGLMCINLLKKLHVHNIMLVGFDGYSLDIRENYYEDDLLIDVDVVRIKKMNQAIEERIKQLSREMNISFGSSTRYSV